MKIGILISSEPRGEVATGASRLEEAIQKRGHESARLYAPDFSFQHFSERIEVKYLGKPFTGFDALIYRPNFIEEPSLHAHVPLLLMQSGCRVLNGGADIAGTKNKLAQHVLLSQLGLPMPRWAIAKRKQDALEAAQTLQFPVIVKTPFGTHGIGIFYAENAETLQPIVDYLGVSDGNPAIIEAFVSEAGRKDVRVFVMHDEVLAAMEREAPAGDVRANAALGGVGMSTVLSDEERDLALAVSKAFACEVAGVDLLRTAKGPLVIEVNANPGFAELERATGMDIAGAIVDAALKNR